MKSFSTLALFMALSLAVACDSSSDPAKDAGSSTTDSGTQTPSDASSDTNLPGGDDIDAGSGPQIDGAVILDIAEPDDTGSVVEDVAPDATLDTGTPDVQESSDTATGDADSSEPGTGFPSAELQLMIIAPSQYDWAQSAGAYVNINGLLFGHADTITWIHEETGATGEAAVGQFWYIGGVELLEGTNTISVIATSADETSADTVHIVYNPTFAFDTPPRVSPRVLFTGESTQTVVTLRLATYQNFTANTLKLHEVDEDGSPISEKASLLDNGSLGNCDEVDKDGLYSACVTLKADEPKCIYLRASVEATAGFNTYTAWSPVTEVCAVDRISVAECTAIVDTQKQAKADYVGLIATKSPEQAQQEVISNLLADPDVAEAGPATNGYGVWILYKSGLLGALSLSPEGWRASSDYTTVDQALGATSDEVGSKSAAILAPYQPEIGALDEGPEIAGMLKAVGCPSFGANAYQGGQASLYRYRHMSESGVVAITAHGDAYFEGMTPSVKADLGWEHEGSAEVLWTGQKIECAKLLQNAQSCSGDGLECANGGGECVIGKNGGQCIDYTQVDLRRGRAVFGDENFGITPEFVSFHSQLRPFNRAIVYLGACRTLFNGGFAAHFFGSGALAILGYSDYVTNEFAHERGLDFFTKLINEKLPAGEAFGEALEDPSGAGGWFRLFGSPKSTAKDSNIINPSFETGDDTGWLKAGDGRVIAKLGSKTTPVDGKFMGLISSGLGFTQQVGELKQKFCIDPSKSTVTFYWKYFSEEFTEFCGSSFQDAFLATIENETGKITLVEVKVDDLCPPGQCFSCGSKYVGLVPSDVSFDQGDVYNTNWNKAEANVSVLAGGGIGPGPVTLKFFVTDTGDSIYDTVVLIDKIEFK